MKKSHRLCRPDIFDLFLLTEVHVKIQPSPQNEKASTKPNKYNNVNPSNMTQ